MTKFVQGQEINFGVGVAFFILVKRMRGGFVVCCLFFKLSLLLPEL